MLPRAERLSTREFAVAFSKGRPVRHALISVRVHKRGELQREESNDDKSHDKSTASLNVSTKIGGARAAFVVPKKVGKAVVRNKLRRRVREIYRLHPSREALRNRSLDLIFLLPAQAVSASQFELTSALNELLRRVLRG